MKIKVDSEILVVVFYR